ncbi:accessory Sec system protein Asp1 [Macrococcoides bohemicum]|uniref:accessory Sec system protein Asp1 n=1 Tax=Macrococcoides bohemicum TaxID=1903056 RepID=UPI0028A115B4|nr:accessory Sec system protein Asp1 [Macrococcus bohemicus]
MKYFIPAWYQGDKWWRDLHVPFYLKSTRSDFDDMISLMNMHLKNNKPFKLIHLSYHSGFQLFLHRNNLYEIDYYSVFDYMQNFPQSTPRALDFKAFNWPSETEFIYTLHIIKAIYLNEVTNIYYNEDGFLVWMEKFIDDVKVARYIFDNRGFLSSIILYEHEYETAQLFLDIEGDIVFVEDFATNKITIKKHFDKFKYKEYKDIEQLISEQLQTFIGDKNNYTAIVASDVRHNQVIEEVIPSSSLIFSIFEKRQIDYLNISNIKSKIIVDTKLNELSVSKFLPSTQILRITPFDTQIIPSISNQLYIDYIGIFIDNIDDQFLMQILELLSPLLREEKKYCLKLMTRHNLIDRNNMIQDMIKQINDQYISSMGDIEDLVEEEIAKMEVIKVEFIPFETDLLKLISELRIMVDLGKEPDLYIQIGSISTGIPQINYIKTDYVLNEYNGIIIEKPQDLLPALNHYLKSLKNWNISRNYSFKLIDKYSSENIINKIDQFIKGDIYGKKI